MLEPFVGQSEYINHGQRVVEGQRLMQSASDIMLGWIHVKSGLDGQERDFYLRQLWDAKGSAIIKTTRRSLYCETRKNREIVEFLIGST